MFDRCIEITTIERIYERCEMESGYIGNPFNFHLRDLDKSSFSDLDCQVEYAMPTIENLFSQNKINKLIYNYPFKEIKFIHIDNPGKRKRKYREEYIPYLLSTTNREDQSQYIVDSNGKLDSTIDHNIPLGVCPIIIMKW